METPPIGFATHLANATLAITNASLRLATRIAWHKRLPSSPRRICIWRTGNIGDIVCALPAMASIRRTWPSAELTLLTSPGKRGAPGARELLETAEWLSELVVYHPSETSARSFAAEIRKRDFDLVIRLPQNMSTPRRELRDIAFLRLFAGVSHARGFAVGSLRWLGKSAARALSKAPDIAHESDRQLQLLPSVCVQPRGAEFPLPIHAAVRSEADQLFTRYSLTGASILCISPGAKRITNRWPVERFGQIARRWLDEGGRVLVIGAQTDHDLGEQIRELGGTGVTNLCGQSPLLLSTAILKRAEVLVSGDTGAIHLAAAVGTPVVVPFSARDVPKRWFPYQSELTPKASRSVVHRRTPSCSPCWLESCPNQNLCLTEISVDHIWESTIALRGHRKGYSTPAAIAV
ncbi:MAG: ADP-heptose:LPS heptosyltransferase [Planctomycetota bacterium]|jgi:ADP-heptose:LPS heptosyltransferase